MRLLTGIIFLFISELRAQNIFTLADVIERAQKQSPDSKRAETEKETSYWRYQSFKTTFNPQLVLSGGNRSTTYKRSYESVTQPDGSIAYRSVNQTNPDINLGLQQIIPWTGGTISVNSNMDYFNNLASSFTQWNSTIMNVRLTQPVFSVNSFKWNRRIQPFLYEESRRSFVEQQEFISSEAARRFFDVLQAQTNLQTASYNLANNDTIYKIEQGRYNIGTTSLDHLLQVELQLLRSRQAVAQANLDLKSSSLRLRTYLGLKDGEDFRLTFPEDIPQFELNADQALQYARQNRSEFLAFERRRIEAEREVAEAKSDRFSASVSASYGLNNSAPLIDNLYIDPQRQQNVNISFFIPILNWGRNRASMNMAFANKRLNDYVIEQDEINFEQTVITQVSQFEMLRLQIEITKKSDQVAQERYKVAQNRYLIGKIDITNLNIALDEKDRAKRDYIQAVKSFWSAYYDLRRLTLYDFVSGQLLYKPE